MGHIGHPFVPSTLPSVKCGSIRAAPGPTHFLTGITAKSVAFQCTLILPALSGRFPLQTKQALKQITHWPCLCPQRVAGPDNRGWFGNKSQMQSAHNFRENKASERRAGPSSKCPTLLLAMTNRKQFESLTSSQHPAVSAVSSGGTRHQMRVLSRNPAKPDLKDQILEHIKYTCTAFKHATETLN